MAGAGTFAHSQSVSHARPRRRGLSQRRCRPRCASASSSAAL